MATVQDTRSSRGALWLDRFLPPRRPADVPWSGGEVLIGFLLSYLIPRFVNSLLDASGIYRWLFWPRTIPIIVAAAFGQLGGLAGPWLAGWEAEALANAALLPIRQHLWAAVLGFPVGLALLLPLLSSLSGTRPAQLGLTWRDRWRNLGLGVILALVLTPLVLGIQFLALWLFRTGLGVEVTDHPLYALRRVLRWFEWPVLLLQVLFVAPFLEELLFRGLLQPWLCQRRWGGHLAVALSLCLALSSRIVELTAALMLGNVPLLLKELVPVLFVLALLPIYALVVRRARTPAGPALFGTALLFGMVHAAVWPTPIALFVLGLGLGWLAWRTQSLVGPITMHALFNAVGSLGFLS